MNAVRVERLTIIILSLALLIGAGILAQKRKRPLTALSIVENGVKEQFTLKEVEQMLKEERRININKADREEIETVPGIGKVLAERIVEYREYNGPFYSEKDLLQVGGIGEKKLEGIREYIRFDNNKNQRSKIKMTNKN